MSRDLQLSRQLLRSVQLSNLEDNQLLVFKQFPLHSVSLHQSLVSPEFVLMFSLIEEILQKFLLPVTATNFKCYLFCDKIRFKECHRHRHHIFYYEQRDFFHYVLVHAELCLRVTKNQAQRV
jgi:hypothetical protein